MSLHVVLVFAHVQKMLPVNVVSILVGHPTVDFSLHLLADIGVELDEGLHPEDLVEHPVECPAVHAEEGGEVRGGLGLEVS